MTKPDQQDQYEKTFADFGFTLESERWLDEEQSTMLLYRHDKTGARLLHMKNDDDNKLFSIGFRTTPTDSTGVCHILEHAVLNGSEKFQTKEPFMDLVKSSLNTFLNAMTFGDKTLYPVASRNQKDFENLTSVYLDAVFRPNVLQDERIFLQEGWRYEIFNPEDPITYRGVVYNEMKGALSSPEDQVIEQINQNLMPNTTYAENSGGDPYAIPTLTYEDFCAFHQKNYHPSNSYIFLYGDIDVPKMGEQITSYLDTYERIEIDTLPKRVERFSEPKETEVYYATAPSDPNTTKGYLSYNVVLGEASDHVDRLLSQMIPDLLIESEAASLKQTLLRELGAEDVFTIFQPAREIEFSIVAKNVDLALKDKFISLVEAGLRDVVENGFDEDLKRATLNSAEYKLREKGNYATKGIIHLYNVYDTWLYDGDPVEALRYRDVMDQLHAGVDSGLFESYVKEHILENPHRITIVHRPDPGRNEKRDQEQAEALKAFKESLSPEEIQVLIDKNEALLARQNELDTPEQKATIPTLSLDDVNRDYIRIPREEEKVGAYTYLWHDLPTAGIHYLDFLFDISHIDPSDAPYVALVSEMIGMLDTTKRRYQEFANVELLNTGGISTRPNIFPTSADSQAFTRKFQISTKLLGTDTLEEALALIQEQLFETKFDDRARIKEVVLMIYSQLQMSMYRSAHMIVRSRAISNFSAYEKYNEMLNGLDFYLFIQKLVKEMRDEDFEKLESLYQNLITANGALVNITTEREHFDLLREKTTEMLKAFPQDERTSIEFAFTPQEKKEAFLTSADVQYVSMAQDLKAVGGKYSGALAVLTGIVSNEFLYNEVRAKGGAYGVGVNSNWREQIASWSYRDPNLANTLAVYEKMGDYIASLELSEEDLTRFVIGAVGGFDQPLTEKSKGLVDLNFYLTGRTPEDIEALIESALDTTVEDLKAYAPIFQAAMDQKYVAVLGSEKAIRENEELFDEVISLI